MNDTLNTFDIIAGLNNEAWKRHGLISRPTGPTYCLLLLEIAHAIIENVPPKDLTDELFDYMTDNNYHTARQACEVARDLLRKEGEKV